MSVCAKNSGERGGLSETEVKQRRRNVVELCRSLGKIECRPEPSNEIGGDDIRTGLLLADPRAKMLDVEIL
jgi:hypothetical protein